MSVNLQKGSKINLSKECSDTLKKVNVGLGWDTRTDLDSFAFLIDDKNKVCDTVYFGNKKCKGVKLNGDNITGKGDGDDEIITVNFEKVPDEIIKIKFGANIFAAGFKLFGVKKFSQVKGAYVRLVNVENDVELCRYNLTEDGKNFNAFIFAELYRMADGTWNFEALGQGVNGSVDDIKKMI